MTKIYKKFFEDELWQKACELQEEVFKLTKHFPSEEKYGLISQLNRSSNSVLANIAESHGRFYFKDKMRVLYIVRGEIEETQSYLFVAVSRGYIFRENVLNIVNLYEKLKMMLNGKIRLFSIKK